MNNIENIFDREVLNNKGIVIVYFWAEWCSKCKIASPMFEKIKEETPNIKFCKLNIDKDKNNTAKKLGVMTLPTIIIFNNGIEINRLIGLINEKELKEFIKENVTIDKVQ